MSNPQAAPIPLAFNDGTTWRLSPFTDADIAELDRYVQHRYIQMARDSLPPEATKAQREETLAVAMNHAMGLTFMAGMGAKLMASVDGVARVVWQGLRHNHPHITVEEVRAKLFNPVNLLASTEVLAQVNSFAAGSRSGKAQPQRKKRK